MQNKFLKNFVLITCSAMLFWSCKTQQYKTQRYDRSKGGVEVNSFLVDSILQEGLDGEALYTLLANIKPMSSVATFSFPLANADSSQRLEGNIVSSDSLTKYQNRLMEIQQAINHIHIPDIKLILVPYRNQYGKNRVLQINAIRVSTLDSLLDKQAAFFSQFGLVRGADPAVVLTVNEYEKRYERLRGYGYLFGYPDYAVNFFLKAFHQADTSGKHVERNFFQIPTYSSDSGRFVYAYPKGEGKITAVDSSLYKRSVLVLEKYRNLRKRYLNSDSTIRAYDLIRENLMK